MARYSGSHARSGEHPSVRSCPTDRPRRRRNSAQHPWHWTPREADAPDDGAHVTDRPYRRATEALSIVPGRRSVRRVIPKAQSATGCPERDQRRGSAEFLSIHARTRCVKRSTGQSPTPENGSPCGGSNRLEPLLGPRRMTVRTNCPPMHPSQLHTTLWFGRVCRTSTARASKKIATSHGILTSVDATGARRRRS